MMTNTETRIETNRITRRITLERVIRFFIRMLKKNRITAKAQVDFAAHRSGTIWIGRDETRGRRWQSSQICGRSAIADLGECDHGCICMFSGDKLQSREEISIEWVTIVIETKNDVARSGAQQPVTRKDRPARRIVF